MMNSPPRAKRSRRESMWQSDSSVHDEEERRGSRSEETDMHLEGTIIQETKQTKADKRN